MIEVKYDRNMLEQVERKLGGMKSEAPKVLKLAVNDTARKAKSRLAKEAQKKYEVKGVGINKVTWIKFATTGNLAAVLYYKGKKIPLYNFKKRRNTLGTEKYYNPTLHRMQTGKGGLGASAKLLKSSSFKSENGAKLKWFITKMGSGHVGIFQRTGVPRYQGGQGNPEIEQKMGKSIPQMIGDRKRVYGIVKPHIQNDLQEAVNRHVARVLNGEW